MTQEKKALNMAVTLMVVFFTFMLVIDYLAINKFSFFTSNKVYNEIIKVFLPLIKFDYFLRLAYLLMLAFSASLIPSMSLNKNKTKEQVRNYRLAAAFLSLVFIMGNINFSLYDMIVYPITWILATMYVIKGLGGVNKKLNEGEEFFKKANTESSGCSLTYNTIDKGPITFKIANSHFLIDAGTRSGKSESFIKPAIKYALQNGWCALIYDYNGDPTKSGQPIQTKTAYLALMEADKEKVKTKFAFLNPTDMTRTVRVNILAERYVKNESLAKLFFSNFANTIMKNLEPLWSTKPDFWAKNAISYLNAVMYMYYKHEKKYCDLPHVIATCLYKDFNAVFRWMEQDDEVCRQFGPMYTAWKNDTKNQLSGQISSNQLPLTALDIPQIFWIFGSDDFNLDITNKNSPACLCLGNSSDFKEAVSSVISSVMLLCQSLMENDDKNPCLYAFDELNTCINLELPSFLEVIGKYNVCVMMACQNFGQVEDKFGKNVASNIRSNVGNYIQGRTGNLETAKYVCEFLGHVDKIDISYSESVDSHSTSERLHEKKILQNRDVGQQDQGHFLGWMLGGKPPYFSAQFDYYKDKTREVEIPRFAINFHINDPNNSISEDKKIEMLNNMVMLNYKRVHDDVAKLMAQYVFVEEE